MTKYKNIIFTCLLTGVTATSCILGGLGINRVLESEDKPVVDIPKTRLADPVKMTIDITDHDVMTQFGPCLSGISEGYHKDDRIVMFCGPSPHKMNKDEMDRYRDLWIEVILHHK